MVAVIGVVPLFIAVNDGISPTPLLFKPTVVLLFAHLKEQPADEKEGRLTTSPFATVTEF